MVIYRLDNKSHGRASMSSEPKVGPESDTDSMAEYGDGDTGKYLFNLVELLVIFCFGINLLFMLVYYTV